MAIQYLSVFSFCACKTLKNETMDKQSKTSDLIMDDII